MLFRGRIWLISASLSCQHYRIVEYLKASNFVENRILFLFFLQEIHNYVTILNNILGTCENVLHICLEFIQDISRKYFSQECFHFQIELKLTLFHYYHLLLVLLHHRPVFLFFTSCLHALSLSLPFIIVNHEIQSDFETSVKGSLGGGENLLIFTFSHPFFFFLIFSFGFPCLLQLLTSFRYTSLLFSILFTFYLNFPRYKF